MRTRRGRWPRPPVAGCSASTAAPPSWWPWSWRSELTRQEPPTQDDERATLEGFLDYHRATLLLKTDGLDRDQLGAPLPSCGLTLAGVLKHLAYVEDFWFQTRFAGRPEVEPWASAPWAQDPDWEFNSAVHDEPDQLRRMYVEACGRSRRVSAGAGLDDVSLGHRDGERWNLRYVLVHLIEETARHNGHADLLREGVDGSTGE